MIHTDPALNGVPVSLYRLNKELSPHPFRNRVMIRGLCYEAVAEGLPMQVHFFSKEALRWRNDAGKLRTLGYLWTTAEVLQGLDITPLDEEWVRYRIKFSEASTTYYSVLGVSPQCPLDGEWLYYRVDFEEDSSADSVGLEEQDAEQVRDSTEELIEVEDV